MRLLDKLFFIGCVWAFAGMTYAYYLREDARIQILNPKTIPPHMKTGYDKAVNDCFENTEYKEEGDDNKAASCIERMQTFFEQEVRSFIYVDGNGNWEGPPVACELAKGFFEVKKCYGDIKKRH